MQNSQPPPQPTPQPPPAPMPVQPPPSRARPKKARPNGKNKTAIVDIEKAVQEKGQVEVRVSQDKNEEIGRLTQRLAELGQLVIIYKENQVILRTNAKKFSNNLTN